jgi:hypothetical protein
MKTATIWRAVSPARAGLFLVAVILLAPFFGCGSGGGGGALPQLKTPACPTALPSTQNATYPMPEPLDPNEYLSGIRTGSDRSIVTAASPSPTASPCPADTTLGPDGDI